MTWNGFCGWFHSMRSLAKGSSAWTVPVVSNRAAKAKRFMSGSAGMEEFYAAPACDDEDNQHDTLDRAEHRTAGDGGLGHFQERLHDQHEHVQVERDHRADDIDGAPRPGQALGVEPIKG